MTARGGVYDGVVLEHFRRPRNRGPLANAEAIGDAVNPLCGDAIALSLTIESAHVTAATFVADACAICIASASLLTEALRGRAVSAALRLTPDDVIAWLGVDLPEARRRCAGLPLEALHRAVGASGTSRQGGVTAIVLGAGLASRFGGDKLDALICGEPVIRRSVRALAGAVDRVVVVTGANESAVREALSGLDVSIVVNARPADGMSGSLRAGIAVASDAAAVLIALGDQPYVPPTLPRALLGAWRATHPAIVVPRYDGMRGHPVLFSRGVFREIEELQGDVGAREVIARDPTRVLLIDVAGPVPRDVDTPADLAALTALGQAG